MSTHVTDRVRLRLLLGAYPATQALLDGTLRAEHADLDIARHTPHPHEAFTRAVRELTYDAAELALVTFLMARARGRPLVLLPAVLTGRFHHPYLVCHAERAPLSPRDLAGKRIGLHAYAATSATWLRGLLHADFGVDPADVQWVSLAGPHVAGYTDPPNVRRAEPHKALAQMLLDGEIDAAIVGDGDRHDPRMRALFRNPALESAAWHDRNEAIQIDRVIAVREDLVARHPDAVRELFALLQRSRRIAAQKGGRKEPPFGLEANRRNLEVAIDYCYRQHLIDRRLAVDELFCDLTRELGTLPFG